MIRKPVALRLARACALVLVAQLAIAGGGVAQPSAMPAVRAMVRIEPDTEPPVVTIPRAFPRSGVPLFGTEIRVRVTWSATDPGGSGIDHYELMLSRDGQPWKLYSAALYSASPSSASLPIDVRSSGSIRFQVRGVDKAGNIGAWAVGPTLRPTLVQESSTSIIYGKTWTTASDIRYSGGGARYASAAGATASYTFTGRAIGLVTTRKPTRGMIQIYLDGALQATLDLSPGTSYYRYVAWELSWSTAGTHTVKVVVLGTPDRPRVDLDAFAVLR